MAHRDSAAEPRGAAAPALQCQQPVSALSCNYSARYYTLSRPFCDICLLRAACMTLDEGAHALGLNEMGVVHHRWSLGIVEAASPGGARSGTLYYLQTSLVLLVFSGVVRLALLCPFSKRVILCSAGRMQEVMQHPVCPDSRCTCCCRAARSARYAVSWLLCLH